MATTETSNRWFIPDHAYRTLNGDYALTCRFANRTKREILLHDSLPAHFATLCCPPRSFLDALEALRDGYGYFFANSPTLVYADVDTSDPAHEKELKARIAGVQELETGIEKNEKVKENFIKHFADVWTEDRKNFLRRHGSRPEDADEDASKVVLEADVQAFLHATMGNPVPAVLDYIISLDNEDGEREEALMLVTAQARLPAEAQRPVLVLVNMVDTAQSRVVGETKGYKTAYDPLSNELIIRPFHSKGGSYHPLGDNWHAPLPTEDEDGETCFRGEPREFFIEFMAFAETMTGERYTPSAGTDGVRFLVWARAMDFVLEQFPALLRVQGGEKKKVQGVTLGGVHEVFDKLEEKFAGVEFLRVEKGEGEGEEDELDEEVSALKGFVGECEWGMRCAAVAVRGKGKEGERKAEEAARMWGRIEEAIRGFEAVAKGEK